ncbi:MAG: class I SAM-dependent methyltransferase [Elusimicrobiales bacterium]
MGAKTRKVYELAAATYDAVPNSVLFTETETVLAMLSAGKGDRVLDAACGTGKYVIETLKTGAVCVGLDFSGEMLAIAATKCPGVRFVKHDLMSLPLPFAAGTFTKIVLAHSIRHIAAIDRLFTDFARLLKPDGGFVVSITHPDAAFNKFKYRSKDCDSGEDIDISDEKYRYSSDEIEKAGLAAGLRLKDAKTIRVDARLSQILTAASYEQTKGDPLILVLHFLKPA